MMHSPNPHSPSTNSAKWKQQVTWFVLFFFLAAIVLNIIAIVTKQDLFIAIFACIFSGLGVIFAFLQAFPSTISHLQQSWRFGIGLLAVLLFFISIGLNLFSFTVHKTQLVQTTATAIVPTPPSLSPPPLTPLPSSPPNTHILFVHNLNIPCISTSDGRNPDQADCKTDFPVSLTLNSIDLKQHPTVWTFTLAAQPGGQESFCSGIQFTNVQLTDAGGNSYPAGGGKESWSLSTGQSQSVQLTFDIPQSESMFQLNVRIHNCHYYTTYQTLPLST